MSEQDAFSNQAQPEGSEQQPLEQPAQQQPYQQPAQQQWQQPYQQQPGQQQWQQPQQPYQQQWQQPYGAPYGQPGAAAPAAAQSNSKALVALICGIIAIVLSSSVLLGIILGIVAIVFAVKAKKEGPDGKATAGLVCGIIGIVLSVLLVVVFAICLVPIVQNGWQFTSSSSKSSAPKASLADTINGEVVIDDAICTIKLSRMEIDDEGNLNIYYTLKNNASTASVKLDVHSKSGEAWELNGKKVDCVVYSWADGGETKEDQCMTVPASYLDIESVDEVESLSGTLVVDFGSKSKGLEYRVDLYA